MADLRARIHRQTGTSPANQHLRLYSGPDLLAEYPPACAEEHRTLASLQLQSGWTVHCVDTNPLSISAGGALENVALVEKFRLSDEQYHAKSNTLRAWARAQKEANPNFSLQQHAAQHQALVQAKRLYKQGLPLPDGFMLVDKEVVVDPSVAVVAVPEGEEEPDVGRESVAHVKVSDRCQVAPGRRRGQVAWMGELLPGKGYFVGVVFDEPVGLSDGTKDGFEYFTCQAGYGGFCRGRNVQVGKYPVRDIMDSDSDDDDDDDSDGEL